MKKVNIFCNIILLLLVIIACLLLKRLNFINYNELGIILEIIGLIFIFFLYIYIKNNSNKSYIIFNIFSVTLIFITCIINFFLLKTCRFIDHAKNKKFETLNYYLLVLHDEDVKDYKKLEGKVGTAISVPEFIKKDIEVDFQYYNNQQTLSLILFEHKVKAILVDNIYYNMMQEIIKDFDSKIKVLKIFEKTTAIKEKDIELDNEMNPFVLYLSGIDTYGNIEVVSRSDVNILLVANPKIHKVLLVSIPRDYYIRIPNTTGYKDKLTHTGIYGINTSVATIESLLGIKIDYYLRVNFNTVIELIDSIGGVDINSDISFKTSNDKSCNINKGINHVNGKCALALSRERFVYKDGDRQRGKNQQEVIKGVISSMTTKEELLINYLNILDKLSGKFQTNFNLDYLGYYIHDQLKNKSKWEVETISLNGIDSSNYTYSCPYQKLYVMEADENTINSTKEAIDKITNK